jgi:uncharacterized repeat protein (TIGR01451 family)
MSRPARLIALTLMLCLPTTLAFGYGTPAGTELGSQAVMTYTQGSSTFSTTSNLTTVTVNEVLDFVVEWQDAASVPVFAGDVGEPLTFRLQNTGNGIQSFQLTGLSALAGDDFDPDLTDIYLDADGDGAFDATQDSPYVQGVNDPELGADQQVVVFLVCNVPEQPEENALGSCKLGVGSTAGYGAPGTVIYGGGDEGTDAIIGLSGGFSDVTGSYQVVTVSVALVKTGLVTDPHGGSDPVAGAVITYTVIVSVSGSGVARDLTFTDALPANTAYIPESLALNQSLLTDDLDADPGDVGQSTSDVITVALGEITAGSADQTISFQVRIQ